MYNNNYIDSIGILVTLMHIHVAFYSASASADFMALYKWFYMLTYLLT